MPSSIQIKLLLLFGFLSFFNSYSQVPDYFENNPSWGCGSWSSNQWTPPYIQTSSDFVYYVHHDTTIGSNTYKSIYSRGVYSIPDYPYFNTFDNEANIFMRQNGRALYYYDQNDNTDSLYINYDVQIGDTLKGRVNNSFLNDSIQKIDSILINGTYRHVFYIDTITGPVVTEGIGHQSAIDQNTGEMFLPYGPGIGFDHYINCFGQNELPLWDSEGNGGSCNLDVSTKEEKYSHISIYPNPATDFITIELDKTLQPQVSIYDTRGRLLMVTTKTNINIEHLVPGAYLIIVKDNNANYYRQLIMIE